MLSFTNDFLAVATTLLTTSLVVLVIDTVRDIDNPFGGDWSIDPFSFLQTKDKLAEIDEAVAAREARNFDRVAS
jgi:hypothetical protein